MSSFTIHSFFFFFNDTATTEIYTLSLHDALPICVPGRRCFCPSFTARKLREYGGRGDRKSTRLNSSHSQISYAVFCLKKKNKHTSHSHNTNVSALASSNTTHLYVLQYD